MLPDLVLLRTQCCQIKCIHMLPGVIRKRNVLPDQIRKAVPVVYVHARQLVPD